jgi:hypothetical protein
MFILLICSILTGAILGMRLKVLVLLPALFLIFILAGKGAVPHDNPSAILLGILISGAGSQLGYLAGVVLRFVLAPSASTATLSRTATARS